MYHPKFQSIITDTAYQSKHAFMFFSKTLFEKVSFASSPGIFIWKFNTSLSIYRCDKYEQPIHDASIHQSIYQTLSQPLAVYKQNHGKSTNDHCYHHEKSHLMHIALEYRTTSSKYEFVIFKNGIRKSMKSMKIKFTTIQQYNTVYMIVYAYKPGIHIWSEDFSAMASFMCHLSPPHRVQPLEVS